MTGVDAERERAQPGDVWPVGTYLRVEQWAPPSADGAEGTANLRSRVPVDAHLVDQAGGLHVGALLTVIDSVGGYLSGLAVQPDGVVTTSMGIRVGRRRHVGPLVCDATVLRKGRASVVTRVSVTDEGDGNIVVASCIMTCAVLARESPDPNFGRPVHHPMAPPPADPVSLEGFFGVQAGSGPVTRLEIGDHLRNTWSILHGGAIAVLSELAAARAVSSANGGGRGRAVGHGHGAALFGPRPSRPGGGPVHGHGSETGRHGGPSGHVRHGRGRPHGRSGLGHRPPRLIPTPSDPNPV